MAIAKKILGLITEEPWKSICEEEWKKAKERFPLKLKRKVQFRWAICKGKNYGVARYSKRQILVTEKMKMSTDSYIEEFKKLIRHELAHYVMPTSRHDRDFQMACNALGGTRFVATNNLEN